jgi:peptide/nickel transport system substrate-binding protein
VFASFSGGYDTSDPAINSLLRGSGDNAYNGWPKSEALESLRDQWLLTDDLTARKAIAAKIQVQAFQDVPFLPVGSYYQPTAYRSNLTDMLTGLILFTNVRRV